MNIKDNSGVHVLLLCLLFSSILNYYVSYLHKDVLLESLGDQFYYQLITWLSITQPIFVTWVYYKIRKMIHNRKKKKFLSKEIKTENLSPEAKAMLDELNDDKIILEKEIEILYNEEKR